MTNNTVIDLASPEAIDPLTELLRSGAKKLIEQAVQAELEEVLQQYAEQKTGQGRRRVVRNGYQPERDLLTGVGKVGVKLPKLRSREGEAVSFQSALVPPYIRKTATLEAAIPWLYLKGIAAGQMQSALEGEDGEDGASMRPRLSPRKNCSTGSMPDRLTTSFNEAEAFASEKPGSAGVSLFAAAQASMRPRLSPRKNAGGWAPASRGWPASMRPRLSPRKNSSFLSVAITDDGYSPVDPDADTETEATAQGIDGDVNSSPGRQRGRCDDRNRGHADDRRACHECGGLGCVLDRLGRGGTQHRPRHSSVARGSPRMDSTQHQVEPKTSPARWASRLAPCPSLKDRRDRKR